MTDLEIVRLCADAMGLRWTDVNGCGPDPQFVWIRGDGNLRMYDPLHDDAQAMALVKKFDIVIERDGGGRAGEPSQRELWGVTLFGLPSPPKTKAITHVVRKAPDLNRAIVETVAKMQKARTIPAQPSTENPDSA